MNDLLIPVMPRTLYWVVVLVLVGLLSFKEILGPRLFDMDRKWRIGIDVVTILLLIRFLYHVVAKVIQVVVRLS
jgi:hypothetical protein